MVHEFSGNSRAGWLLLAMYLGGIVSANALAGKLFVVGGVHVTAGALAIPIVYLATDMLNELYGPAITRRVVWAGFVASMVLLVMSLAARVVPVSPYGVGQDEFVAVFGITWRVTLASSAAYLVSSLLDVWLFHYIRSRTGDRLFWLRKNASTIVSQWVDTGIFVFAAFAFVIPWHALWIMWVGQYLVKIVAAPLGTPLSYLAIKLARGEGSELKD